MQVSMHFAGIYAECAEQPRGSEKQPWGRDFAGIYAGIYLSLEVDTQSEGTLFSRTRLVSVKRRSAVPYPMEGPQLE